MNVKSNDAHMKAAALLSVMAVPVVTHAASFKDFVNNTVVGIGDSVVNILYTLIFLVFLYGILQFFFLGGEQGRVKGKKFIVSGLIGITVVFSVWGLVRLLINTLVLPGV